LIAQQPVQKPIQQPTQQKIETAKVEAKPEVKNTTVVTTQTNPSPVTRNAIPTKELPADVATRSSETIQSLYFHTDSLVLSLYDNGVVDGDTVSVFVNGNPVI